MSVLYKALQKAAKENEQQAADPSGASDGSESNAFDPERLAGAGSISGNRGRGGGANLKLAGGAAAAVLLLIVAGFFVFGGSEDPAPVQVAQAPTPQAPTPQAPAPQAPASQAPVPQAAVLQEPAAQTPALQAPEVDPVPPAAAPVQTPMDVARQAASSSDAPDPTVAPPAGAPVLAINPTPTVVAVAPAPADGNSTSPGDVNDIVAGDTNDIAAMAQGRDAAAAPPTALTPAPTQTTDATPARSDPMPDAVPDPMPRLDANSPARALSPPISIRRAEAEFAGVGNLVSVREVSQSAQDNVTAGYNALVRGDIGLALELYTAAVQSEPTSVLAQLGRSAALQKLGRMEEARSGYETVLRIDPNNREALTNLISIYSTQAPNEALNRLLALEREYPGFSPVKAQIGLLYARMGSAPDALVYLREAAALDPGTVMYQYNLAVLLDRMGRAEQAVLSYERVLAGMISGGAAGNLSRAGIERRVRYLKTL